ncbi:MAG: hypothetical protein JSV95_11455 [Gemmatimonadota bacterium]|nr:MAG: hypothetical protein JSV95_11455 [Gemmatimonadota bacterium]
MMSRRIMILLLLVAGTAACTKWSEPQDLSSSLGAAERPERLRVVLRDRQGVLDSPAMVGDSVMGLTRNVAFASGYEVGPCPAEGGECVVKIPSRDVVWVEIRQHDGKKTASAIFLYSSIAALATCLAIC